MNLWDWAGQAYARPGVQSACLALQDDHGQCVSFLLWALWLRDQGRAPTRQGLARAAGLARPWEDQVLKPLRVARRALKTLGPAAGPAGLYTQAQALELDTERGLIETLQAADIDTRPETTAPLTALAAAATAWSGSLTAISTLEALAEAFSAS